MNQLYDQLYSHRSIRKYKSQPIPNTVLNRILEAGSRASSSGNMQPYSIIVTKDEEIRKQLLPFHFNQSMVMDAPVLLKIFNLHR